MRAILNRPTGGSDPAQLLKPQCTQSPEEYFDKAYCEVRAYYAWMDDAPSMMRFIDAFVMVSIANSSGIHWIY